MKLGSGGEELVFLCVRCLLFMELKTVKYLSRILLRDFLNRILKNIQLMKGTNFILSNICVFLKMKLKRTF